MSSKLTIMRVYAWSSKCGMGRSYLEQPTSNLIDPSHNIRRTMQSALRCVILFAMISLLTVVPQAAEARGLLQRQSQPGTATAMAGLEDEADPCPEEEYARYKTIVCKMEEKCNCASTRCALDWCSDYVHEWKKTFGACSLKGCP